MAHAMASVLLEDEELVHPVAFGSDSYRSVHERKAGVLALVGSNKWMEALRVPVSVECVAILSVAVEVLVPNVRKVMLVELKHSLDR